LVWALCCCRVINTQKRHSVWRGSVFQNCKDVSWGSSPDGLSPGTYCVPAVHEKMRPRSGPCHTHEAVPL
jgi:hypothetical protein